MEEDIEVLQRIDVDAAVQTRAQDEFCLLAIGRKFPGLRKHKTPLGVDGARRSLEEEAGIFKWKLLCHFSSGLPVDELTWKLIHGIRDVKPD